MPAATAPTLPQLTEDYAVLVEGLQARELRVQQCGGCAVPRHPPGPRCPACGSWDWTPLALSGRGTVHSYIVHHHPPIPPFATPHCVVVADMAEGVRVVAALDDCAPEAVHIGMPVVLHYLADAEGKVIHHFRRADGTAA